jgi:hypothetical protein
VNRLLLHCRYSSHHPQGGSKYSFSLPSGESADILVMPLKGRNLSAKLFVHGVEVVDEDSAVGARGK